MRHDRGFGIGPGWSGRARLMLVWPLTYLRCSLRRRAATLPGATAARLARVP
jgi:hypothetical protein